MPRTDRLLRRRIGRFRCSTCTCRRRSSAVNPPSPTPAGSHTTTCNPPMSRSPSTTSNRIRSAPYISSDECRIRTVFGAIFARDGTARWCPTGPGATRVGYRPGRAPPAAVAEWRYHRPTNRPPGPAEPTPRSAAGHQQDDDCGQGEQRVGGAHDQHGGLPPAHGRERAVGCHSGHGHGVGAPADDGDDRQVDVVGGEQRPEHSHEQHRHHPHQTVAPNSPRTPRSARRAARRDWAGLWLPVLEA